MSKNWIDYELTVNGLKQIVQYNSYTVENLFVPLLRKFTTFYKQKNQRVIVFLVAPPATGKSTLTLFLEKLSNELDDIIPIQAVGMDGFHYHAEYIKANNISRDGKVIPMSSVKGCPETFDVIKLQKKLADLKCGDTLFPIYDRQIHDVVEDAQQVNGKIILFEGNWLLLKDKFWCDLKQYADYSVMIRADASSLKKRLIQRKIQGGASEESAVEFYINSDRYNVERTLNDSMPANETWYMLEDNDYNFDGRDDL